MAVGKTYAEARRKHGDSELLDDLVSSPPTLDRSRVRSAGDISDVSSERLREAVVLLKQKASPEEVETYKGFALTLAESAAHAHREGGRMGVGGEQVSESEQEALHEIAASLQLGPPSRHCRVQGRSSRKRTGASLLAWHTAVRVRCRDLAVVSRSRCVALGRLRWGSSGADAY